ncbi:MAG TPA: tetratricopeptide repeat protein [Verrucomicrobiales bacterium]|nr:tetratricopeptide repeat protein [Verrucomicrobiales bacterium]
MSQSPPDFTDKPQQQYLDAWLELATRIRHGNSFSGREANCAFLNTGTPRFAEASAVTGFDFPDDARGLALTDWDGDGDLDAWVTNRTAPRVRYLRNNTDSKGHVGFLLRGDPTQKSPRDAIGARVQLALRDASGKTTTLHRTLYAGHGFLSQSSKRIHFGVPDGSTIINAAVRWPGSTGFEPYAGVQAGECWLLVQGHGKTAPMPARTGVARFPASAIEAPQPQATARIWLAEATALPPLPYQDLKGKRVTLSGTRQRPLLLTLWATWCQPCLTELADWSARRAEFNAAGLDVLALNVDELTSSKAVNRAAIEAAAGKIKLAFPLGYAGRDLIDALDEVEEIFLYPRRPLPLPCTYLIDAEGRLAAVYKGPVDPAQIAADAARRASLRAERREAAAPFPGLSAESVFLTNPVAVALGLMREGYPAEARSYLEDFLADPSPTAGFPPDTRNKQLSDVHFTLGEIAQAERRPPTEALPHLRQAFSLFPNHPRAGLLLSDALLAANQAPEAIKTLETLIEIRPANAELFARLGEAQLKAGQPGSAAAAFEAGLKHDPASIRVTNGLTWVYATSPDAGIRNPQRALTLAAQLQRRGGDRNPLGLDTIAAAHAAAGKFPDAVDFLNRALPLAKATGDKDLIQRLETRLELYKAGKPYHGG